MKKLDDALTGNDAIKQTSNYINEDTSQQVNFDEYTDRGKNIVAEQTNPNMSPTNINTIADKITEAKMIYMAYKTRTSSTTVHQYY